MADKIPTYGIYNGPSTYWWKPSNVRNGEMWGQGSEANPVLLPEITVTYNKSKYDSYKKSYKERLKERQRELKRLGLYKGRIDGIWKDKSKAAHEEAIKKGYVLDGDKYVYTHTSPYTVVEDTTPYSHVTPYTVIEDNASNTGKPIVSTNNSQSNKFQSLITDVINSPITRVLTHPIANVAGLYGDFLNGLAPEVSEYVAAAESFPWLFNNLLHENSYGVLGNSAYNNLDINAGEYRALMDLGNKAFDKETLDNLKEGESKTTKIDKNAMKNLLGLDYVVGTYGGNQSMGSKALATQLGQFGLTARRNNGKIEFVVKDDYDFSNTGTVSDAYKSTHKDGLYYNRNTGQIETRTEDAPLSDRVMRLIRAFANTYGTKVPGKNIAVNQDTGELVQPFTTEEIASNFAATPPVRIVVPSEDNWYSGSSRYMEDLGKSVRNFFE